MKRIFWAGLMTSAAVFGTGCDSGTTATDAGGYLDAAPDTGVHPDAAPADSGVIPDTGVVPDSGQADSGAVDSGTADGGTADSGAADSGPPPHTPSSGSAIVLSSDDRIAVAANRTADSIAVLPINFTGTATAGPAKLINVPGGEPWAAVMSRDDLHAFVILKKAQQVLRIDQLTGTPTVGAHASTGSEPSAIAISPSGASLYVSNWAEGTVSVLRSSDLSLVTKVDLNVSLASSGVLGGGAASRPGLAHPYAIAVTDNGDDNDADETVYVTEFFSQAIVNPGTTDIDRIRQGMVYRFSAGTQQVAAPITLAPVADSGFKDATPNPTNSATVGVTGCYPNQLAGLALNNGRLYVTSVCTSPRGPVGPTAANLKTEIHAAIFAISTQTNAELPAEGVLLNKKFQDAYDTAQVPDDGASRRMPLLPKDIGFVTSPTLHVAYVSAYGSDAVFRVEYQPDGTFKQVGSTVRNFIDLSPGSPVPPGRLPVGLAVAHGSGHALVLNENSRNVSLLAFATQNTTGAVPSCPPPAASELAANRGRRFFVTGLGRWSLKGQGWNSCEACHVYGLSDNVTWAFARGPRSTLPLDGTFDSHDSSKQRILNWTAIFDEISDFENNVRGNSGGVGAIVHITTTTRAPAVSDRIIFDGTMPGAGQVPTASSQSGLNGSTKSLMPDGDGAVKSVLGDYNDMEAWVKTVRTPRAPTGLVAADVTAGRQLFVDNNCAGCHGGSMWTIALRFYTPNQTNNAGNGLLRNTNYTSTFPGNAAGLNPLTASGSRTAPLRYVGSDGANSDQINCVLRAVGTFPASLDATQTGIGAPGVLVREIRANGAPAQGDTGFSPPSLLGLATTAPYFHAGNARTLEETLSSTFEAHHKAFSANFAIGADQVRQLSAFLLSIDEDTTPVDVPLAADLGFEPLLCPASL